MQRTKWVYFNELLNDYCPRNESHYSQRLEGERERVQLLYKWRSKWKQRKRINLISLTSNRLYSAHTLLTLSVVLARMEKSFVNIFLTHWEENKSSSYRDAVRITLQPISKKKQNFTQKESSHFHIPVKVDLIQWVTLPKLWERTEKGRVSAESPERNWNLWWGGERRFDWATLQARREEIL